MDLLRSQGIDANYNDNEPFSIFPNPNRQYEYIHGHGVVFSDSGIVRSVKLEQKASRYQGGGHPDLADFQDHVINIYDGNYYDATCGAGPYEESQSGFLQYLRENVRITSGDLVCQGDNLVIEDFYSSYYPINE